MKKTTTKKTTAKTKAVKTTKNKRNSEWAEEKNWLKSPVVLIGLALMVMVLLILFW